MTEKKIVERIKTLQYGYLGPFGHNDGKINYCVFKRVMTQACLKAGWNIDDVYLDFNVGDRTCERVDVTLCIEREETEKELEKSRCEKEKQVLSERQYRRKQYQKLKEEFEGGGQ